MKIASRPEDMSPDGRLELIKQDDGDMIIHVRESQDSTRGTGASADVEFCNSGGRSPWTLQALYALQEAMEKDERREPWPPEQVEDACGGALLGPGTFGYYWCTACKCGLHEVDARRCNNICPLEVSKK